MTVELFLSDPKSPSRPNPFDRLSDVEIDDLLKQNDPMIWSYHRLVGDRLRKDLQEELDHFASVVSYVHPFDHHLLIGSSIPLEEVRISPELQSISVIQVYNPRT